MDHYLTENLIYPFRNGNNVSPKPAFFNFSLSWAEIMYFSRNLKPSGYTINIDKTVYLNNRKHYIQPEHFLTSVWYQISISIGQCITLKKKTHQLSYTTPAHTVTGSVCIPTVHHSLFSLSGAISSKCPVLSGFGEAYFECTPDMVMMDGTVYPKKYAHGFCFAVLCCGYTLTDFPISIRLTSLALWQSNDCTSASKATLMNMDKYVMWIHYERLHNHNKAKHNKTVCIFLGIYCMRRVCGSRYRTKIQREQELKIFHKQITECTKDSYTLVNII